MAKRGEWQTLLYFLLGAAILEYFLKTSSTSSDASSGAASDDGGILIELTSGITNVVATLTGTKQTDFVAKMQPIADQIQSIYGIDPLITMTQSALESGWGTSGLTKSANNLFGFTGDTWAKQGKSVIYMNTHEYSPSPPDKIQYFSAPGDIVSKSPAAGGGSDLMVKRPFRAYPTWYDSVADWAALMRTPRYAAAYADAKAGDLQAFANDVAAAGYATEPDYAVQLVSVGDQISGIQSA